jgi:predicted kinase
MIDKNEDKIIAIIHKDVTGDIPKLDANLAILCGLPYAGKSTIAKELHEHNFVHIWLTVIKKQHNLDDEYALKVATQLTKQLLNEGYRVTVDFLNHTDLLRDNFSDVAKKLGVPYKVIFVNTPLSVIHNRKRASDAAGSNSIGRSSISIDVIDKIANELNPPDQDETIEVRLNDRTKFDAYLNSL